jgi:hypothetical protein
MPYEYLDNPAAAGGRIHFRHRHTDDDPAEYVTPATLAAKGIAYAYVDATRVDEFEALNSLGQQLRADHAPYDPASPTGMNGWYRFMDDLETLGDREAGMIMVIDRAATLFTDPRSWGFNLISIWVLQLPRWQRRKAPCHLAFQMEADDAVRRIYGPGSGLLSH